MRRAVDEFTLIRDYFRARGRGHNNVEVGVGDDAAVTELSPNHQLVTTTDTMVLGVHFDEKTPPRAIGHKLVAVNLSDLAAMGAEPLWLSLAITLPQVDEEWIAEFSAGLHEVANYYNCSLIGGDTTRGALTLTMTAHGQVPNGQALLRSTAKPGDWIYVSGTLGDAGLALASSQGRESLSERQFERVLERLHYPTPRVGLGQTLRGIASAAIDISDGLLADLQHVLDASQVGATLTLDELPLSLVMLESVEMEAALNYALTSGDDFELLFTVPEERRGRLDTVTSMSAVKPVCIGQVTGRTTELQLRYHEESYPLPSQRGYNHFHTD